MIEEAHALELTRAAVDEGLRAGRALMPHDASAVEVEALIMGERSALTRFTRFAIHQNVAEDDTRLSLRVVLGGRTGAASTNRLDLAHVADVAARAARFAKDSPRDPEFTALPDGDGARPEFPGGWIEATAQATPGLRAEKVHRIFERCRSAGVTPSGSVATRDALLAIANSRGIGYVARATEAESSVVCTSPGGETGWAEWIGRDIDAFDPAELAGRAADKALAAQGAKPVEPGHWTVVLEPAATAELVGLLSYCGFGALAEQEGRSFLSGRMGDTITGPSITVVDDALDPRTLGWPFDYEGVGKHRVTLIERGVATGVVHDTYTAGRASTRSTGHALPAPNPFGPAAMNLVMAPGDSSLDELVAGTDKGLLVTHFFYTNPLDPRTTQVTGMTRDGLYLIEGGKISGAAKNLRMTESVLEAFRRVAGMSSTVEAHRVTMGTAVVPAVRIEGFTFTSATEF